MAITLSNISLSGSMFAVGENCTITFTLKNTGAVAVDELTAEIFTRDMDFPGGPQDGGISRRKQGISGTDGQEPFGEWNPFSGASGTLASNASRTYSRTIVIHERFLIEFNNYSARSAPFGLHAYGTPRGTVNMVEVEALSISTMLNMRYAPAIPTFTVSRSPNADSTGAAVGLKCTLAAGADPEYEDLALTLQWKEEDAEDFPTGNALAVDVGDALESGGTMVNPSFTFQTGKAYILRATFTDGIDSAFSETKLSKAEKTLNVHPTSKNIGLGQFAVADLDEDDVKRLDMTYRPYFHEGVRDADGREIIGKTDYSTTEVDTGIKWLDGKTLYAKVLKITTASSNVDITSIVNAAETLLIGEYFGSYTLNSNRYSVTSMYNSSTDLFRIYINHTNKFIRVNTGSGTSNIVVYVRLLYTKS